MEKRAIGMILTVLGIIGLIYAAITFVNHSGNVYNIKVILTSGILGVIFFFSGIGLIRGTRDVMKNNEHIS
ncbi:MAG: hypothetical protein JWQ38_2810 [Flavipsychrobacter sp.]|nr:hypothetical protein [Flavipsychrobacter sp.]